MPPLPTKVQAGYYYDSDGDGLDDTYVPDPWEDPAYYGYSTPPSDQDGDGWEDALDPFPADARLNPQTDPDADGVPSELEWFYGMNDLDPADGAADLDGDGFSNAEAFQQGWVLDAALVSPVPDLDGDRLNDITEAHWAQVHPGSLDPTDPTDPVKDFDQDGVMNFEELTWGLDLASPTSNQLGDDLYFMQLATGNIAAFVTPGYPGYSATDPDHDGLPSLVEYTLSLNPRVADSDGDGTSDAEADADGDGATNLAEVLAGTLPGDPASVPPPPSAPPQPVPSGSPPPGPAPVYSNDADEDGLPDDWERRLGLTVGDSGAGLDSDGDGLTNLAEFLRGTHPLRWDTDGDGLSDGAEANGVTLWSDLSQGASGGYYLFQPVYDATGVYLYDDYLWVAPGVSHTQTDPLLWDTDGDHYPDGWELSHGLNPGDPFDLAGADGQTLPSAFAAFHAAQGEILQPWGDEDGDGLWNAEEFVHGGDPFNSDTDGDGITDFEEARGFGLTFETTQTSWQTSSYLDPNGDTHFFEEPVSTTVTDARWVTTSVWNADTDGDLLPDGWERDHPPHDPTNPNDGQQDADGDGVSDGREWANGTDSSLTDSDGDGLSDLAEWQWGFDGANADANGNGVDDGWEDQDGDGQTSRVEAFFGGDPWNAALRAPSTAMTVTGGEEADGTLWKLQYKGGEVMWYEEGETTWLDEAIRTYWQVDGELGQAGVWPARFHHRLAGESAFHSPAYGDKTAALATLAGLGGAWVDAWKASEDGYPCATAACGPAGCRGDNIKVRLVAEGPGAEDFRLLCERRQETSRYDPSGLEEITEDHRELVTLSKASPIVLYPAMPPVGQQITQSLRLLPVEIVSRDKFLAGSIDIPAEWDNLAMEFIGPGGENLGRYGSLLGGGSTKIYDKVTDIMSEADIAAGGQPSNQKVWFVREGAGSRKISYYTCFNSVGQAQIKLYPEGSGNSAGTITHDLVAAQDFADTISYVDAWVKGTSFNWTVPPVTLPLPVLALASQAADDPSASGISPMSIANSLSSGAIITADVNIPLAPGTVNLALGQPMADMSALGNLSSLQILPLDAVQPTSPLALDQGTVYWLANGILHPLTEEQVTTLPSQAGSLTLVAPPPPPMQAAADGFAAGAAAAGNSGPIDNHTRAALIPFFNVLNLVEGLGNVAVGLFDGVIGGLQDDWAFLKLIGTAGIEAETWAHQQALAKIQKWKTDPLTRAVELKRMADKVCEDMVFKPMAQLIQDHSSWEGFRRHSWQTWQAIKGGAQTTWTVTKSAWSGIVDGLTGWADDFCGRMMTGSEKAHWDSAPWVKDQLLSEINGTTRQMCYTFGYTFGYLCEQVAIGALSEGTVKVAQVATKGGVHLAANLAKRTSASVVARAQWLKHLLAESGAGDAVLRAAYERGLVMCAVEPVGPTIKEVIFEVIEKAFSKQGFNRSIYSWKHLQDDILQRPKLSQLVAQQGGEVVFQRRLSQLATILGDEFDAVAAKNFAKVADEILLVKKPDETVEEFFEAFFRAFDGNPSSMVNADIGATFSKSGLSDEGKATLKKFLSDPNAGKLWEIDVPAIVDNEPAIPHNYWIRGILGELAIYKRFYKNAGYEHFPTAPAFDLKSAAEYVQIKTLKNPDGAYGAMTKALRKLVELPSPPNGRVLHILKKPGSSSDQLKAALEEYIADPNGPIKGAVRLQIDPFDLVP